ncbi:MAG: hypothetical protein II527_05450 [Bacteroidales bacterium]|nr:hypothetical protein [Bacteroidales bacterium]MBQ4198197.1 hypothetical protein [Bacteroidales bacterium]
MKKFIAISILALLLAAGPATAQTSSGIDSILQNKPLTEEDLLKMYGADTNVQFQKMQAEMEKVEQQASQTEAQDKLRRQIALIFSLLIAIFPAISLFRLVRKKKVEVKDKSNIPSAVLVLLLGGIVLFAFNYFMIWMSLKHGTSFHAAIAIIAMAVLTAWAIWEYFRKPKDKSQK